MKGVLKVCLLLSFFYLGEGLECYTCSVGEQDTDKTCIDNPEQFATINCNKKYCTVIRQEYKDPQGAVVSIYRGCEDIPAHMNEILEDQTYRFYYVACQTSLCNGGSGKSGSNTGAASLGDKSTLIVPGIGSGSGIVQISAFVVIFFLAITYILN